MMTLTRPPLRSSAERRLRHTKSPAIHEIENSAQHHNAAASTRRSSRSTPLLALNDDTLERQPKSTAALAAFAAKPARSHSKKRPATALAADATADPRPPTKVTVTQPHGALLRITNGVARALGIAADDVDDVPSGGSTPARNGTPASLAVPASSTGAQAQDKRSLRSQDGGSRLKSDLATYFSSYDDIIAGVPKPSEFLDLDTPIYIIDEPLKAAKPRQLTASETLRKSASPNRSRKWRAHSPPRNASNPSIPASQSSTAFQILDYSTISRAIRNGEEDPLADAVFLGQHRRAERKEKQLRNIEKERAMHEKVQLERLLDGLQGPDWLKVMGITGVTDGERKDWEPKRNYFVKEVEALVDKFRIWKEEEKRLRAEKEAALAAREEDEEDEESSESDVANVHGAEPSASEHRHREPEPPKPRRPPRPHGFVLPQLPPEPQAPFMSFYSKPHLRAVALGKQRPGRHITAFGQSIPDFVEHDFRPPEEYITEDALRAHARKRRRQKRESGAKPSTAGSS
ncbi:hypothetical protein K505DRAFT_414936 [Melanomma pulvis-pyrius CBS 109.77]|uniref:Something about silencing protein 4 domain-containing protein n=1 Tax=Melanomma pulvis-pyrius CBS 109.77 TaxID=1314802 RepID=A0A6A6XMS1_9PLEO|nr:hypothetical protein K505DRAFT_414936 [Melanomma pulvis-pyrius CBS 109.77]